MDSNILTGIVIIGVLLLALYSSYTYRHKTSKQFGLPPHNSMGIIAGGVNGFVLFKKYPIATGIGLFLIGAGLVSIGIRYAGVGIIIFILTIGILNLIARLVPRFNKHSFISQFLAIVATLVMCGLFLFELVIPH